MGVELLYAIPVAILVTGLSAVLLARRKPELCTACGKGRLVVQRDFAWKCGHCAAIFRRRDGTLTLEVAGRIEVPRAIVVPKRDPDPRRP